jgi:phosphatidylethanolamine/phosphatidyl-N-methylethanolamine N-methyltransferase
VWKRAGNETLLTKMNTPGYGSQEIFYKSYYRRVIHGKGLGSRAVRVTHMKMEKNVKGFYPKVLEVGGGGGDHLDYVKHTYSTYELLDVFHSPLPTKWENQNIVITTGDVEAIPSVSSNYDRIVIPCLLHHVANPVLALQECNRVLKPGGHLTIFLSCDPGIMVRFLRKITVSRLAKKLGFHGHSLMQARDHRNHVGSLLEMIKFEFRSYKIERRFYPFRVPFWNLNGYIIFQGRKPMNN